MTDSALIKRTQLQGEQAKVEQCWDSVVHGEFCLEFQPLQNTAVLHYNNNSANKQNGSHNIKTEDKRSTSDVQWHPEGLQPDLTLILG